MLRAEELLPNKKSFLKVLQRLKWLPLLLHGRIHLIMHLEALFEVFHIIRSQARHLEACVVVEPHEPSSQRLDRRMDT